MNGCSRFAQVMTVGFCLPVNSSSLEIDKAKSIPNNKQIPCKTNEFRHVNQHALFNIITVSNKILNVMFYLSMASAPLVHQDCAWRHQVRIVRYTILLLHRLIQSPDIIFQRYIVKQKIFSNFLNMYNRNLVLRKSFKYLLRA